MAREAPTPLLTPPLHLHALTHAGWVRPSNEDAFSLHPEVQLAILADGLGGGRAGEVASALAVDLLGRELSGSGSALWTGDPQSESALLAREQSLRRAVMAANRAIHRHAQEHPSCAGMGTTLVMAHWCGPHLIVGHVGDSRAYLLRTNTVTVGGRAHHRLELVALTRDHSTRQRAADTRLTLGRVDPVEDSNEQAPARLTRALGVEADVVLELHRHRLAPGDAVLLCSDGLTDMLVESEVEAVLMDTLDRQPLAPDRLAAAAQSLLKAALDAGGHDNISLILGLPATPRSHSSTTATPIGVYTPP